MNDPPKQERAARTRARLLRAAAEVFDESGYAGASVANIVKRAEVTLGAMYFHFSSKEDLARSVMNAQAGTIAPFVQSEGLQRLVDVTLRWSHQLQDDPVLRAGVRLAVEQEALGTREESSFEGWRRLMTTYLEEARDQGQLQQHADPEALARFVVGACTGVQLYSQIASNRADLPQRTMEMWQILLPGIAVPGVAEEIEVSVERGRHLWEDAA